MRSDVLVVGGGVAGLRCAVALSDAGLQVTVAEAGPVLGGRAASWRDPGSGDVVDVGPHVVVSEYRHLRDWLQRLGSADEIQWQPDPLITLLDRGRVVRMRSVAWSPPLHGLPNLPRAWRSVRLADMLSNWRVAWRAMRLDERRCMELDEVDAASWLRAQGVTPAFIDWFWRSATMALLNVPLEQCSAASAMRLFRLLLGRSGYCFGFPRVGLAELFAPASRHVIERAGGQVLMDTVVRHLQWHDGRCVGGHTLDGLTLEADAVVLALPPAALAALWPQAPVSAHPWQPEGFRFAPSPYVSTLLWFDRPLSTEAFWARTWRPGDLNMDFYDLSRIRHGPPGAPANIAANWIHAVDAEGLDDEEVVRRTCAELADFAPDARSARLLHARVHRIPMAVPCPRPGFERARPPQATSTSNLWLAGDWTRTGLPCSMESAARSGALAAEGVAARMGRELQVSMPTPETYGLPGLLRARG